MSWIAVLFFLLKPGFAEPRAEFYALGGFYQDEQNHVQTSHTFFRYMKVIKDNGAIVKTEVVDISWLPEDFHRHFRLNVLRPSAGHNYSFEQTVEFARRLGLPVACIGPYPISEKLFVDAMARKQALDRGEIKYAAAPLFKRLPALRNNSGGAVNCISANSQLAGDLRTRLQRGYSATSSVVGHFARAGELLGEERPDLLPLFLGPALASSAGMHSISSAGAQVQVTLPLPSYPPQHRPLLPRRR